MSNDLKAIWQQQYDPWVPQEIDRGAYQNVLEMMLEAGAVYSDMPAFSSFGSTLTYAETLQQSHHFAAYLQSELGIQKGDRVALMVPNSAAFAVAMFGIMRTGAIQVNVNPLYTPRELRHQLCDADVETIVVFSGSTATLAEVLDDTPVENIVVSRLGDFLSVDVPSPEVDERIIDFVDMADAVESGQRLPFDAVSLTQDDLLFLQYTGGTTGLSKGAMLSHGNLVANMLQFRAFVGEKIAHGDEVVITAIPMYHIFALMVNTLCYFWFGATNVLITNPRDMDGFVEEWSKWPVTTFTGVNTLYNGLLHTPTFQQLDFSSLKIAIGGGAAVQKAVSDRWKAVTGIHIKEGYGLSETSPALCFNPFGMEEFRSSIGVPISSTEVSLRDDGGNQVPVGERGEICARGPQVMHGYWRRPDATAEVMTDDGFFKTGDIAVMDEHGYLRIVDRKKDIILVSGFNVFPNEIEAEVAQLEGVLECACVGVPDDASGEAVKLFVVKANPDLNDQTVREFCKERLTGYKVPKHIDFIDELPKSTVGKILRRELRE